jgi:hypothetical protein
MKIKQFKRELKIISHQIHIDFVYCYLIIKQKIVDFGIKRSSIFLCTHLACILIGIFIYASFISSQRQVKVDNVEPQVEKGKIDRQYFAASCENLFAIAFHYDKDKFKAKYEIVTNKLKEPVIRITWSLYERSGVEDIPFNWKSAWYEDVRKIKDKSLVVVSREELYKLKEQVNDLIKGK